ncbi:flavin reductase family protein [Polynucleobacter sp. es-GGE-1]|jgi:flavin reductase (DIM6/NTAB) family NADH-FMN oxidoreductase RutF|uniref:flavin reductase family protein n=1 Tax=unclassified Polynucleobacter TaxID=2640945 RepID=UPI001BFECA2E|nr:MULTISPECIES: flavin reductase family protein [unclassified Polynucleobacter]MBU3633256.1 flavin reductase family protein [Polynucleobacter sp. AP-Feld-500C-C5]MBU3635724.1 flavin reductase family protein [Polynucleobacter sp. es-GGE-1]MEA9600004.1 flavin reductase family protein [Polynucleobacter sp. AP-Sanab-80-C2]QWE06549.1 flavin reductase family protein [Polynucleobacter sp. JS-JIR-5-A7]
MTPFTSQELRKGFASFATGVTVITCIDENQHSHGITISSFNTVSLEPPLILWSLKKHSRLMPWVEVGKKHLIHVLERSQENLAMHFATVKVDQFAGLDHKIAASGLTQIDHCVAYYECETVSVHVGGDHNIIVAKVIQLKNHPEKEPLIFARSKFVGLDFSEIKTS